MTPQAHLITVCGLLPFFMCLVFAARAIKMRGRLLPHTNYEPTSAQLPFLSSRLAADTVCIKMIHGLQSTKALDLKPPLFYCVLTG